MARRRRDKRPEAYQNASVPVGREVRLASRNPLLLPRPIAPAFITGQERLQSLRVDLARFRAQRLLKPRISDQVQRRRIQLLDLRRPFISTRKSPCRRRAERKQVMFAKFVAGRSWGSGSGPQMRFARRTEFSNYSCR